MMPLTNVQHPGNPAWNCCKAKPAKVVEYHDGSAIVTCVGCAQSAYGLKRHELPEGWTPATASDALKLVAEAARRAHFQVACSDDLAISASSSPIYKTTEDLFKAAIAAAYPDLGYAEIYDVWLGCFEDLDHCATVVRQRRAADVAEIIELLH